MTPRILAAFGRLWRKRQSVRLIVDPVLPWLLVRPSACPTNARRGAFRYRQLICGLPGSGPPARTSRGVGRSSGGSPRPAQLAGAIDGKALPYSVLEGVRLLKPLKLWRAHRPAVGTSPCSCSPAPDRRWTTLDPRVRPAMEKEPAMTTTRWTRSLHAGTRRADCDRHEAQCLQRHRQRFSALSRSASRNPRDRRGDHSRRDRGE
jgi:hypothetical protein